MGAAAGFDLRRGAAAGQITPPLFALPTRRVKVRGDVLRGDQESRVGDHGVLGPQPLGHRFVGAHEDLLHRDLTEAVILQPVE